MSCRSTVPIGGYSGEVYGDVGDIGEKVEGGVEGGVFG